MNPISPEPPNAGPSMSAPAQVAVEFLTALARGDTDAAIELVHPDIIYVNVGWPTIRGRKATDQVLRALGHRLKFNVQFINVSANGNIVLTERIDELAIGRLHWQFWVCGRLEISDGQVIVWRDYFDHLHMFVRLLRALAAVAIPSIQRPLSPPSTT